MLNQSDNRLRKHSGLEMTIVHSELKWLMLAHFKLELREVELMLAHSELELMLAHCELELMITHSEVAK